MSGRNPWREEKTYRLNDIVNELLGLVDLVLCVGHDQTVQVFLLVAGMGSIRATLALLDGAFSTNRNLGARFCLHFLQSVATGPNE